VKRVKTKGKRGDGGKIGGRVGKRGSRGGNVNGVGD